MANMNVVVLSGNLTRDPELKALPSGNSVTNLRLAVNDRFKDRDGEWKDRPFYFNITVWGKMGENVAKYLGKGDGLVIQGKLEWREWEGTDGSKRQAVDVVAREVQFMPKGGGGGNGGGGSRSTAGEPPMPRSAPADDDDIPF